MEHALETDLMVDLIGRKLACLEQLRDLSRRQADLIAEGNIQRLLSVLSAKQTLLAELQKAQQRLEPFRKQDPESRVWRSAQDRQRCRQVVERCETLLGEILVIEKHSEAEMAQRQDAARERLQASHSSADATRAYIRTAVPARGSLDLSSGG